MVSYDPCCHVHLCSHTDSCTDENKEIKALDRLADVLGAKKREKKEMTPAQWSLAFDARAVSDAVTGNLPFTTSLALKVRCRVCAVVLDS